MIDSQEKTYWVQVFNETTWHEFLGAGGTVTGFRDKRWAYIQRMKPGDELLCYLSGHSKWIGILEVISEPFLDVTRIWKEETFPCRVNVKVIARLPLEKAISIHAFRDKVSILRGKNWSLWFINSPTKWKPEDAKIVEVTILDATRDAGAGV